MKIPTQAEILQAYADGKRQKEQNLHIKNTELYKAALAESKLQFTEEKVAAALIEAARNQYWVHIFRPIKYEVHNTSGYAYHYIPFPYDIVSKIRKEGYDVETWENEIKVTLRKN